MGHRGCVCLLLVLSSLAFAGPKSGSTRATHKRVSRLPVTTTSALARKRFAKAMENLEYIRQTDALQDLRAAVKADPNFAQARILIAYLSHDPDEQESSRKRAKQLAVRVGPGERLLIRWLAGVQEDDYLPAIAAMNDLLARYPRDQRLAFLAGAWLVRQERYSQARVVLERAVSLAPNYPAALNELGYAYAFSGDFAKAFVVMDQYIALQPDQPNPHDSYGEILREAGKFDAALVQYRISIQMDPGFGSELGVADTYALMGKEEEARAEYARAILFVPSESEKVEYELQSAATWIREGNQKQAERAVREVVRHAHNAGLGRLEAEAHRILAMSEPDYKPAMKHLQQAQQVLHEHRGISRTDLDEEQARILKVMATRSAEAHAEENAFLAVKQLETMAHDSHSRVIQLSYHAAAGALLSGQKNYAEAVAHLEEDADNPLSMRLLWQAYSSSGANAQAQALANRLIGLNTPTIEQALVVPQFRASLVGEARQP